VGTILEGLPTDRLVKSSLYQLIVDGILSHRTLSHINGRSRKVPKNGLPGRLLVRWDFRNRASEIHAG
jgi:hypothetical protein